MRFPTSTLVALASLWFVEPTLGASTDGSLTGEIAIVKNGAKASNHSNVVVYLEGVPDTPGATRKHAIKQKDLQFSPRISVVVKGTTVDFPNEDRIFHNVFSTSRPARFDLGLYRSGSSKSVEFKREGVVDVFCNIHPEMISRVLVVPTRHFATTDAAGKFRIDGVPAGTYNVVVWHPNGTEVRTKTTIQAAKAATLTTKIDEGEKPKGHRRKDGSLYGRYE
jgi:plastocyanin